MTLLLKFKLQLHFESAVCHVLAQYLDLFMKDSTSFCPFPFPQLAILCYFFVCIFDLPFSIFSKN